MTYTDLRFLGKQYEEITKLRTATSNRLKHLELHTEAGEVLDATLDELTERREIVSKHMIKLMNEICHPRLLKWQEETKGIGAHLLARFLSEVGDPIVALPQWWEGESKERHLVSGEPYKRTPQQFFRYSGYGDPKDKRRKGQTAEEAELGGRPMAKSLMHELAEGCIKLDGKPDKNGKARALSPYRWIYDHYRTVYATREGWTPLHQSNAAWRKVKRAILLDIWLTAQGLDPVYGHGNQPGKFSGQAAS